MRLLSLGKPLIPFRTIGLIFVIIGLGVVSASIFFKDSKPNAASSQVNSVVSSVKKTTSPIRVGLQVGHLDIANVPPQLSDYQWDFGAQVGEITEVGLNNEIATRTATVLRQKGYLVDVLTATVPANYTADVFVAIHADALPGDTVTSGFEVGASSYDKSGQATTLAQEIDRAYSKATGLSFWPAVSDAMTSYYAFDSAKFTNSVSSKTPAVLIECGFISNDQDRTLLVNNPQLAAEGIAQGIDDFVNKKSIAGLNYPTNSTEDTQTPPASSGNNGY